MWVIAVIAAIARRVLSLIGTFLRLMVFASLSSRVLRMSEQALSEGRAVELGIFPEGRSGIVLRVGESPRSQGKQAH